MNNVADILSESARRAPAAVAMVSRREPLSYRMFDALVWRTATILASRGVSRADVVVVSCLAETMAVIVVMALARLGASVLSLPLREPRALRVASAARCGARWIVTDVEGLDDAGLEVLRVAAADIARSPGASDPTVRDPDPRAPWLIVIGSGSTGAPKRIDLTHRVVWQRTLKNIRALGLTSADRCACAAHFDHAVVKQRFVAVFACGATVVLCDRGGRCRDLAGLCRDERVTVLDANVVHLEHLLASLPADATNVLGGLRALRIGASMVSPRLRDRLARTLTAKVHVAYSMNEFGGVSLTDPGETLAVPDSVGKALRGVELEVVDPEDRPVASGEVGAVRVRGPGMIDAYVDDEQASANAFRGGWFYPGDLGVLTPEGSLLYRGRADQMMILDGINIYPAEIEQAMLAHEAVAGAVAVKLHSDVHQDLPVCAVELHAGKSAAEEALQAHAIERLGVRSPRRVVVLSRIPRTEQGKVVREELFRMLGQADARANVPGESAGVERLSRHEG
ncbi:MAG: acyl--CoA ligase [Burkholderiaceae bacterium]|nr:acyl--CoA ligase [Burkholderiaceae bacterium]